MNRFTAAAASAVVSAAYLLLVSSPAFAFGPQEYSAKGLKVDGVIGRVDVTVSPTANKITVAVTGPEAQLARVKVQVDGDQVVVEQESQHGHNVRITEKDWVTVTATVPTGSALTLEDLIGEAKAGDLKGPLTVSDLTSGKIVVGHVSTAKLEISGSGDVTVGQIDKDISVEINGSGEVKTGTTSGKASLEINGSGDVTVASVQGPVDAEINGSGDVTINEGTATSFDVEINGSGDVKFGGNALSQSISQNGSGKVRIGANAVK